MSFAFFGMIVVGEALLLASDQIAWDVPMDQRPRWLWVFSALGFPAVIVGFGGLFGSLMWRGL